MNESELRIDYPNGSRIQLFGADNPDNYHYTRADLLRFVSDVTGTHYTDIEFDGSAADNEIDRIYTPREKELYAKARAAREAIKAKREADRQKQIDEIRARKAN